VASKIVHVQDKGLFIHLFTQFYHVVLKAISINSFLLNLKVDEASLRGNCCHSRNILQSKL
jgi:hypothetical protein